MKRLASRLKKLRKSNNLTQTQLGHELGFSKNTIASYEQNKRRPTITTLCRLADFFNVSVDFILGHTKYQSTQDITPIGNYIDDNFTNSILKALGSMTDYRSPYKKEHSKKVTKLAVAIGKKLNLSAIKIKNLKIAGLLENIGEIFVPDSIINKPEKLTDSEFNLIKDHAKYSYNHLKKNGINQSICGIVLQHHETNNGSGYPNQLTGPEILIEAKILRVADTVEAMISNRPHRSAKTLDITLHKIRDKAKKYYDSDIVEACCEIKKSS